MSNNFEIVIQMLKKSLILIALFFVIAAIPARAESLQELINRHKEQALIKAKIKMQELIADTLEMKKYRMYKPEYRNINNFDYYYQAQLDLNNNAFYYDDTTSIYSILDTTRIALDRIYVLDKRHNQILNLCDDGDGMCVCSYGGDSTKIFYENIQTQKKIFKEELPLLGIWSLSAYTAVLYKNKIYVQRWMDDTYIDINDFIKNDTNDIIRLNYFYTIRREGISKRVDAISKNKILKPQVKRDFSKSIKYIEKMIDSLDDIYLRPVLEDKKNKFYSKMLIDEYTTDAINDELKDLGITIDEFVKDSAKLSFRSEYHFRFNNYEQYFWSYVDSSLEAINLNRNELYRLTYYVFWENKLIGHLAIDKDYCNFNNICINQWIRNGINEYADFYEWCIAIDGGYLCKINDELKIIFGYNEYFKNAPISFDLFIEQVLDEYYVRKFYQ